MASEMAASVDVCEFRFKEGLLPQGQARDVGLIWRMHRALAHGLVEHLKICDGELVLDPMPAAVRHIKFGTPATIGKTSNGASELCRQVAEFFTYVREVDAGEIRALEIRHGLPFSMEVDLAGTRAASTEGDPRG